MTKTATKPAASTAQKKTADDLRALKAQLTALQQQREQANAELGQWGQQLTGSDADRALVEVTRLREFIDRMDADIKRMQTEAETLTENLKSIEQKAAEKAAAKLKTQQDKRRAELAVQLPNLIIEFNDHADQLKEKWLVLRGLLTEEAEIALAHDERTNCLLGGFPVNQAARIPQLGAHEERGYLVILHNDVPLFTAARRL